MKSVNTEAHDLLSLTYQPLYMGKKLFMSFTAAFAFDLATGGALPASEAYAAAMRNLAPGDCLDMGVPKVQTEWLLAGSAFPHPAPASAAVVTARVGGGLRRLSVERKEPFGSFPLTWNETWGSDAENPAGLRPGKWEKPSVTDAGLPFGAPACMGPRGAWPCRMSRMGTYSAAWLRDNWPGVPDDFDWTFYNLSQPSQRLPRGLNGGEKIFLENLNKDHRVIESEVPKTEVTFRFETKGGTVFKTPLPDTLWLFPGEMIGLLLRHAAVECENEAGEGIDLASVDLKYENPAPPAEKVPAPEKAAAAEKVPETAAGAAMAGTAAASSKKSAEAAPAAESASGSGAEETAPASSLRAEDSASGESDMISAEELRANMLAEFDSSLPEINAALAEAGIPPMTPEQADETRRRINTLADAVGNVQAKAAAAAAKEPTLAEALARAGVPDEQIRAVEKAIEIPVPSPGDFSDAASWTAAANAYADEFGTVIGADSKVVSNMKQVFAAMPVGGESPAPEPGAADCAAQLVKAGMEPAAAARFVAALETEVPSDPDALLDYASKLEEAAGFPKDSVRGRIAAVQEKMKELGVPMPGEPEMPAEAAETANPVRAAASVESEKAAAEPQPPANDGKKAEETNAAAPSRESVIETLAAGGSLSGAKLDGLDLSGLNLSGQNLAGTSFVKAKLDGARLDGANLAGAVLTGASLAGCLMAKADLSGANLAGASAPDADFSEAVLTNADAERANLSGAAFTRSVSGGLRAAGADFGGARVSFSDFSGADFSRANLKGIDFHASTAEGANFSGADLSASTFCWGSRARNCAFSGAKLDGANWTRADAAGSDFGNVSADGASFTDCGLAATRWTGSRARGGDFSRSNLENADLRGIDLFRGSLRETRVSGADLSKSNLFAADLCRTSVTPTTKLDGADTGQTIMEAVKEL